MMKRFEYINPAKEYLEKEHKEGKGKRIFGYDRNIKGSKYYVVSDYETIRKDIMEKEKQNKSHAYEWIINTEPVKLFVDIDINKCEKVKDEDKRKKILMEEVYKCHEYLKGLLMDNFEIREPKYILLKSENKTGKISGHLIYPEIIFDKVRSIKDLLLDNDTELIREKIFDPVVYKAGCFRTYKSCKMGKTNKLMYDKESTYKCNDEKEIYYESSLQYINDNSNIISYESKHKKETKETKKPKHKRTLTDELYLGKVENKPVEIIEKVINLISKKRCDNYEEWLFVGMGIYNTNNTQKAFELWDKWSQQSEKYDKEAVKCKWNSFNERSSNKITFGTIIYYARSDNPEKYKNLDLGIVEEKENFESININCQYLTHEWDTLIENIDNVKCLGVKSAYNTGKTTFLTHLVNTEKYRKILYISYRQTLTNDIYGKLKEHGFCSYMNGTYNAERLICQIESLHRLQFFDYFEDEVKTPKYDLIVLDEIESLLMHFMSPTIKQEGETFDIFHDLLTRCNKILALDGDLHNRSYEFLKEFGNVNIIKNSYIPEVKNFKFTADEKMFYESINKDLNNGKNIYICTMTSTIGQQIYDDYVGILGEDKMVLHCSKSDDKLKENLKSVNNFWNNKRLVICSPCIESGVDFNVKNHFHKIYGILSLNSTSPRGFCQMLSRVRNTIDNNVMIYLNKMKFTEKGNIYQLEEVENMFLNCIIKNKLKMNAFVRLYIRNKLESLNSQSFFMQILIRKLKDKGHYVKFMEMKKKDENKEKEKKKKEIKKPNITIRNILQAEDMDKDHLKFLLSEQRKNRCSMGEKYMIERYFYKKNWKLDELNEEIMKKIYQKTHILKNYQSLLERQKKDFDTVDEYYNDLTNKMKEAKYKHVLKLINKLGFDGIDDEKYILGNELKKTMNKIIKGKLLNNNILVLFNVRTQSEHITSKSFLGILNQIFKNYGFKLKYDRARIEGQRKQIYKILCTLPINPKTIL